MYLADGQNMKVYVMDRQSLEVLYSFGDGGRQPGLFFAVHSITTDSQGNIYTTETYEGSRMQKFRFTGHGPEPGRRLRPGVAGRSQERRLRVELRQLAASSRRQPLVGRTASPLRGWGRRISPPVARPSR
jgi:hypothetical protein